MKRKVYCVGYGQVSAAGDKLEEFRQLLYRENSRIKPYERSIIGMENSLYCGLVENCAYEEKFMHMAEKAMLEAIHNAGFTVEDFYEDEKTGFVFGTSLGDTSVLEDYSENKKSDAMAYSQISFIGQQLRKKLKVKGMSFTLSNTCCTGISAISVARQLIIDGTLDFCIVGCVELLGTLILSGMNALNALSKKDVLKPFSADRDGILLGEGAAFLVLSNQPVKDQNSIIAGCAITNDGVHLTAPDREAGGLTKAIEESLMEAEIVASDIDVVFCCGNGTMYNDSMQAKAIHRIWGGFKKEYPVTSIKPLIGHTLSVSGIIETIAILCMMEDEFIVPIGEPYMQLPEDKPISLLHKRKEMNIKNAILLSSGFSGVQAAQVIRK